VGFRLDRRKSLGQGFWLGLSKSGLSMGRRGRPFSASVGGRGAGGSVRLMKGAFGGILLIALALVPLSWTPAEGSVGGPRSQGRVACGVERWAVKTLQDRPVLLPRKRTTVAYLVSLPRPLALPDYRLPFERHIFQVIAPVTLVRPEDDGDLHVVLRPGRKHMIAEAPAWSCTRKAKLYRRRQMAHARQAVRLCSRARVTGVAFFDFKHGQTGVAPNAIELHPILGFECLP
jgi:hypothetical protein